jgi:hypothetical protein
MTSSAVNRPIFWVSCCILFIYFSLSLTATGEGMFGDTDPFWHIAAGDLIRSLGTLPAHDSWSFTAGDTPWFNIAWIWDVVFSYLKEHLGWHGVIAVNAMILASIITLIYISCMVRCGDFVAAMLTTILTITLVAMHLRPLQISTLLVLIWMLILSGFIRERIKSTWLIVLPITMILWVNMHGGFLIAPMLIGAFFLQAVYDRRRDLAWPLFLAGAATMLAILCNPYGIYIFEGTLRTMNSEAKVFIDEWQPFLASPTKLFTSFFLLTFCLLVPKRVLPILPVERLLAYFWLVMGLTANRNLTMFAIISAPILACAINQWLDNFSPKEKPATAATLLKLCSFERKWMAVIAGIATLLLVLWLPSPMAARIYQQENIEIPMADLDTEIQYIKTHLPTSRLLAYYDYSGIIAYKTRGEIPVFFDSRAETAYSMQVAKDYIKFHMGEKDWEEVMKRYNIDGVIIPNNSDDQLYDRFAHRRGWKEVFKGPKATIFLRTPK